jgi:quinol monooxygenase YgiN
LRRAACRVSLSAYGPDSTGEAMSIVTIFELRGDPDEILALQDEKLASLMRPVAEKNGGISHTAVKTDDGVMVINHWENEEGMERASQEIRPHMQEAGGPTPENWRSYEVARHVELKS